MSNQFWYGFALGVGLVILVVLVSAGVQKAIKSGKR